MPQVQITVPGGDTYDFGMDFEKDPSRNLFDYITISDFYNLENIEQLQTSAPHTLLFPACVLQGVDSVDESAIKQALEECQHTKALSECFRDDYFFAYTYKKLSNAKTPLDLCHDRLGENENLVELPKNIPYYPAVEFLQLRPEYVGALHCLLVNPLLFFNTPAVRVDNVVERLRILMVTLEFVDLFSKHRFDIDVVHRNGVRFQEALWILGMYMWGADSENNYWRTIAFRKFLMNKAKVSSSKANYARASAYHHVTTKCIYWCLNQWFMYLGHGKFDPHVFFEDAPPMAHIYQERFGDQS